jgi:hypothetical protein
MFVSSFVTAGQSMKGVSIRWCVWQERNKANHQEKMEDTMKKNT